MMLPNAHLAVVEQEKVTGYLLNAEHAYGKSKARFFNQFGFTLPDWEMLAKALCEHGRLHPVSKTKDTFFGSRFEVDGELNAPDGRAPRVRTVWQVDHD